MTDWKPQGRIKDPTLLALLKFEFDCCEITGETCGLHLHHVILKSGAWRGDDVRANIICIYDNLHARYHGGDSEARLTVALHIRDNRPDTCLYIARKLGGQEAIDEWFARHNLDPKGIDADRRGHSGNRDVLPELPPGAGLVQ